MTKEYQKKHEFYNLIEWYKKKARYDFVKIHKTGLSSSEIKKRKIQPWIFSSRVGGLKGTETKKYFKTKPEAMNFAKEFMKKYD